MLLKHNNMVKLIDLIKEIQVQKPFNSKELFDSLKIGDHIQYVNANKGHWVQADIINKTTLTYNNHLPNDIRYMITVQEEDVDEFGQQDEHTINYPSNHEYVIKYKKRFKNQNIDAIFKEFESIQKQ